MTIKASGGTALATDLLLEIEALNSEDADDEGSKAAVVTALKAAAQLPVQELEAFAEVFADLLQILDDGCGIGLSDYVARKQRASLGNVIQFPAAVERGTAP
jgi:hypothetical protein